MSWQATAHVLGVAARTSREELSATEMLVLLAIAARHNSDYECAWGQLETIARDTHLGPSALAAALNHLEAAEQVTIWTGPYPEKKRGPTDGRKLRGNLYCLVGLDPPEGPNVHGALPRRRAGGRPKQVPPAGTQSAQSVPPDETHFSRSVPSAGTQLDESVPAGGEMGSGWRGDEFRQNDRSVPAGGNALTLRGTGKEPVGNRHGAGSRAGAREGETSDERTSVVTHPAEPTAVSAELPLPGAGPCPPASAPLPGDLPPAADGAPSMSAAVALWTAARPHVAAAVSAVTFESFCAGLQPRGFAADGRLVLEPANPYHLRYCEQRLGDPITVALAATGQDVGVLFVPPPDETPRPTPPTRRLASTGASR